MWALRNRTPFAAERAFVRDKNGAEVFVVAVKATFGIDDDGGVSVAEAQEPVRPAPVYRGEPGASSLLYEADLILAKPSTDVLVHGHAYAPGGVPATRVEVSLRVGSMIKRALVIGDRTWVKGIAGVRLTDPEPFERMPIQYERAFGGSAGEGDVEAKNPVGVGFAREAPDLAGKKAPNVEAPDEPLRSWNDRPAPVGFGPIAREWWPRAALAGTYDEKWQRERMPLPPLDYDERFAQCAPADQQVPGYLRGGEIVELRNMTPGGLLRFTIPSVALRFASRLGGKTRLHGGNLHTVIVEPDERRVILVWHAAVPCHHTLYTLRRTTVSLEPAEATA